MSCFMDPPASSANCCWMSLGLTRLHGFYRSTPCLQQVAPERLRLLGLDVLRGLLKAVQRRGQGLLLPRNLVGALGRVHGLLANAENKQGAMETRENPSSPPKTWLWKCPKQGDHCLSLAFRTEISGLRTNRSEPSLNWE